MLQTESFTLDKRDILSIIYHDIFDYPLTIPEIIKWRAGKKVPDVYPLLKIEKRQGYYFLEGKKGYISSRLLKERDARRKLIIAKKASRVLSFLPFIKMVAVSGALAMGNTKKEDDIDLFLISKGGFLWLSRILSLFFLQLFGFKFRRFGSEKKEDRLCLNMWFDEGSLVWRQRNIYTAHEIAQIIPLVNKEKSYEQFILKNKWIDDFWPNAVRLKKFKEKGNKKKKDGFFFTLFSFFEPLAYRVQNWYMRGKVTKETVTLTRAIFHPLDRSKEVVLQFNRYYQK